MTDEKSGGRRLSLDRFGEGGSEAELIHDCSPSILKLIGQPRIDSSAFRCFFEAPSEHLPLNMFLTLMTVRTGSL